MAIIQDVFDIPDDIATGLGIGQYRRFGSVIRYAEGSNKGQIVKHLKSIDLKADEHELGFGSKALQFVQQHKKGVGIIAIGAVMVGVSFLGYSVWKNSEPKVLKEFRAALKTYIEAIRQGNMNTNIINTLLKALEALKQYRNFEKISIQLATEELSVLVGHIYEYTIKLVEDNSAELVQDNLQTGNNAIINLEEYLKIQKKIFEERV